jgi:hypothetical protein
VVDAFSCPSSRMMTGRGMPYDFEIACAAADADDKQRAFFRAPFVADMSFWLLSRADALASGPQLPRRLTPCEPPDVRPGLRRRPSR